MLPSPTALITYVCTTALIPSERADACHIPFCFAEQSLLCQAKHVRSWSDSFTRLSLPHALDAVAPQLGLQRPLALNDGALESAWIDSNELAWLLPREHGIGADIILRLLKVTGRPFYDLPKLKAFRPLNPPTPKPPRTRFWTSKTVRKPSC